MEPMGEKIQKKKNKRKPIKIPSLLKPNLSLFINVFRRACLMISLSLLLINHLHWHLKPGSSHEFGLKFSLQWAHP